MEKTEIKNKIIEFLKQPLIYVVIICIICQMRIYSKSDQTRVMLDSTTYISYAQNTSIFRGQVDEKRTPVYPYFIKAIMKIGGEENLASNVATVQKYLFILTLILFYACLKSITKNNIIVSVLTLIFGTVPSIILWNVPVLTEPIAILEMVLLALITIRYLKKPNYILAGSTGILILIMIMTRPSFVYVLPIYILFWILKFFFNKEERKQILVGLASCAVCIFAILGYCTLMNNQYGEFALTRVSNLNNVVSVIQSKAYKKASNGEMIKVVDECLQEDKNMWNAYEALASRFSKPELEEFASSAIKTSEHMQFLIKKTVQLGTWNVGTCYANNVDIGKEEMPYAINYIDVASNIFPVTFGFVYFMMAFSAIYLIWNLIKTKQIDWMAAFFTVLILANLFTLIVGAPEEEQRLFVASIPLIMLYMAFILENILKRGKKNEEIGV